MRGKAAGFLAGGRAGVAGETRKFAFTGEAVRFLPADHIVILHGEVGAEFGVSPAPGIAVPL